MKKRKIPITNPLLIFIKKKRPFGTNYDKNESTEYAFCFDIHYHTEDDKEKGNKNERYIAEDFFGKEGEKWVCLGGQGEESKYISYPKFIKTIIKQTHPIKIKFETKKSKIKEFINNIENI